ncbi:hypothetical protein BESB_044270 [Besnoitia besnoiti]|uniref:BRCT domain-containing protein n=1 Tax=Besnoitia besnoiti TaxID=94643 RepID=A0A2A9ME16_BESBE|nr:hypothetical protein BESB_044270 [Besnoitia besnoiti]PFH36235.1 hypothetical protein BESB_044270 [Besnoitia besnoiti]
MAPSFAGSQEDDACSVSSLSASGFPPSDFGASALAYDLSLSPGSEGLASAHVPPLLSSSLLDSSSSLPPAPLCLVSPTSSSPSFLSPNLSCSSLPSPFSSSPPLCVSSPPVSLSPLHADSPPPFSSLSSSPPRSASPSPAAPSAPFFSSAAVPSLCLSCTPLSFPPPLSCSHRPFSPSGQSGASLSSSSPLSSCSSSAGAASPLPSARLSAPLAVLASATSPAAPPAQTADDLRLLPFLCSRVYVEFNSQAELPAEVRLALRYPHGYELTLTRKQKTRGVAPSDGERAEDAAARGEDPQGLNRKRGGVRARQRANCEVPEAAEKDTRGTLGRRKRAAAAEDAAESTRAVVPQSPASSSPDDEHSAQSCLCPLCRLSRALEEAGSLLRPFGLSVVKNSSFFQRYAVACQHAPSASSSCSSSSPLKAFPAAAGTTPCVEENALAVVPYSPPAVSTFPLLPPSLASAPLATSPFPSPFPPAALPALPAHARDAAVLVCTKPERLCGAPPGGVVKKRRSSSVSFLSPDPALPFDLMEDVVKNINRGEELADPRPPRRRETGRPARRGGPEGLRRGPRGGGAKRPAEGEEAERRAGAIPPQRREDDGVYDAEADTLEGWVDAVIQLHDMQHEDRQALVVTNHYAGIFSNNRVVLTYVSHEFRNLLLREPSLKFSSLYGPRTSPAAASSSLPAGSGVSSRPPSLAAAPLTAAAWSAQQKGTRGAINDALQLSPTFALKTLFFEGASTEVRPLLRVLRRHASQSFSSAGSASINAASTFSSFREAAKTSLSSLSRREREGEKACNRKRRRAGEGSEADGEEKDAGVKMPRGKGEEGDTGRKQTPASPAQEMPLVTRPLKVFFLVSSFPVRNSRVRVARAEIDERAVEDLTTRKATKRVKIRGSLLPLSLARLLRAFSLLGGVSLAPDRRCPWASGDALAAEDAKRGRKAAKPLAVLPDLSLFFVYKPQPHAGAPFADEELMLCIPHQSAWRQFRLLGGALKAKHPAVFERLRTLFPPVSWAFTEEAGAQAGADALTAQKPNATKTPVLALPAPVPATADEEHRERDLANLVREELTGLCCLSHQLAPAEGESLSALCRLLDGRQLLRMLRDPKVPQALRRGVRVLSHLYPYRFHSPAADQTSAASSLLSALLDVLPPEHFISEHFLHVATSRGLPPHSDLFPVFRPAWVQELKILTRSGIEGRAGRGREGAAKGKNANFVLLLSDANAKTRDDGLQLALRSALASRGCAMMRSENIFFSPDTLISVLQRLYPLSASTHESDAQALGDQLPLQRVSIFVVAASQSVLRLVTASSPSAAAPRGQTGIAKEVAEALHSLKRDFETSRGVDVELQLVSPGWIYECHHTGTLRPPAAEFYRLQWPFAAGAGSLEAAQASGAAAGEARRGEEETDKENCVTGSQPGRRGGRSGGRASGSAARRGGSAKAPEETCEARPTSEGKAATATKAARPATAGRDRELALLSGDAAKRATTPKGDAKAASCGKEREASALSGIPVEAKFGVSGYSGALRTLNLFPDLQLRDEAPYANLPLWGWLVFVAPSTPLAEEDVEFLRRTRGLSLVSLPESPLENPVVVRKALLTFLQKTHQLPLSRVPAFLARLVVFAAVLLDPQAEEAYQTRRREAEKPLSDDEGPRRKACRGILAPEDASSRHAGLVSTPQKEKTREAARHDAPSVGSRHAGSPGPEVSSPLRSRASSLPLRLSSSTPLSVSSASRQEKRARDSRQSSPIYVLAHTPTKTPGTAALRSVSRRAAGGAAGLSSSPLLSPLTSSPLSRRRSQASSPLAAAARGASGGDSAPGGDAHAAHTCCACSPLSRKKGRVSASREKEEAAGALFCPHTSVISLYVKEKFVAVPGFLGIPVARLSWLGEVLQARTLLSLEPYLLHATGGADAASQSDKDAQAPAVRGSDAAAEAAADARSTAVPTAGKAATAREKAGESRGREEEKETAPADARLPPDNEDDEETQRKEDDGEARGAVKKDKRKRENMKEREEIKEQTQGSEEKRAKKE